MRTLAYAALGAVVIQSADALTFPPTSFINDIKPMIDTGCRYLTDQPDNLTTDCAVQCAIMSTEAGKLFDYSYYTGGSFNIGNAYNLYSKYQIYWDQVNRACKINEQKVMIQQTM